MFDTSSQRRLRHLLIAAALIGVVGAGAPRSIEAQAWQQWEQSARAMAMGGAGAALVDAPDAAFFNPAGIVHLVGTRIQTGGRIEATSASFQTFGGGAFDREARFGLTGSLYATHDVARNLSAAISINTPWGWDVAWDEPSEFVGRFRASAARLQTVAVQPVLAYSIVPAWSVAVGLRVISGSFALRRFEQDPALSALGGGAPVALAQTAIDTDAVAVGWGAGVYYRRSDRIAVGGQLRNEITLDLSGVADFRVVAPDDLQALRLPGQSMTIGEMLTARFVAQPLLAPLILPRSAVIGVSIVPVDGTRLAVDVQWTGWGAVDEIAFDFADSTLDGSIPLAFDDTWSIRVGAEVLYRERWLARAGIAHQPSPAPGTAVTPLLPDADRTSLSLGLGVAWRGFDLDGAYRLAVSDDRQGVVFPENNTFADGRYETIEHVLAASVTRRF